MKFLFKNRTRKQLKKALSPKLRRKKLFKKILFISLYALAVIVFVIAILFAWFSKDLPTPSKIANAKPAESTKLYDRTGEILLYETGEQKRTIIKSDQISQYLKDATVATEDANFYNHHGFDSRAIIRATMEKITGQRRKSRGASTITQQYVKNALLSSDRSMTRKIKELILSIELEMMYSKDDILTMYLNEIPYGNSTAGAEAGSKMYFGKNAKDISIAEAATLAAIPQAPTYYSPYGTHTEELEGRKDYVLDRMVGTGKLSFEEAKTAKEIDTLTLNKTLKPRKDAMLAPHFAMYVLENIAEEYGESAIQKQGMRIITSLDFEKQKQAEEAITSGVTKINQYGASNAGMVAVDPKTGEVLAMVGSIDYFNAEIDGNVNITDSKRQPGSSFKPYTYATLFKQKDYSPSKILYDFQTDFGGGYVPKNYNGRFNGPVTIRQALSNSLNIPAVKALSLSGIDNVIKTAEDMGITTLNDKKSYGLSFALGVAEIKPVEAAGGFGVFAANGTKHDLKSVLKISDAKGKTIYEYEPAKDKGKQVLDPQIAYEISNILSDNNSRAMVFGTHSQLYFPNRTVAAKSGTTNDNKDAWTVGYTPSISVAVWVGNNKGSAMKGGADGSIVAAPIFHKFIETALANTPNEDFVRPDGIQELEVDKYSNKLPTEFSPEKSKDIFAVWQVPQEKDDIHIRLQVCKSNGKLAPDDLPDSYTDFRLFTNLHSERPDYANWENPVRGWAQANGLYNTPPKDYCSSKDIVSTISITSPAYNSTVSGSTILSVNIASPVAVKNVEYFIEGVSIGSSSTSPYSLSYNFSDSGITEGLQTITAVLTDENTGTSRASTQINVLKNSGPIITNITAQRINLTSVTITWTTNVPSNTQVHYKASTDTDYKIKSLPTKGTAHSITIDDLSPNQSYSYRISANTDGTSNSFSEEKTF